MILFFSNKFHQKVGGSVNVSFKIDFNGTSNQPLNPTAIVDFYGGPTMTYTVTLTPFFVWNEYDSTYADGNHTALVTIMNNVDSQQFNLTVSGVYSGSVSQESRG
jgi:hypothetical protein